MSLSQKRKVKLNPFQIFIFLSKFSSEFQIKFPHAEVTFDDSNTYISCKNQEMFSQAQKKIKSWVSDYRVQTINVKPGFQFEQKELQFAELKFGFILFNQSEIQRQFRDLQEKHLNRVKQVIERKMANNLESIVIVAPNKTLDEVKNLIQDASQKCIEKKSLIDLELPSKKLLISSLIGCLNGCEHHHLKLTNKDDSAWVQGLQKSCVNFKTGIHEKLNKLGILVFDAHDQDCVQRILKMKFKQQVYIFTYRQTEEHALKLKKQYSFQGPFEVYKNVKETKPFFLIVVCPSQIKQQISDELDRVADTPTPEPINHQKKRGKQKKEELEKFLVVIPSKYFSLSHMKAYFSATNIIQPNNDIKITLDKLSQTNIITLQCGKSVFDKKLKIFKQYFKGTIYYFVRDVNYKLIDNIIAKISKKTPENVFSIEFVSGFSSYGYYEIMKNQTYQQEVISKIIKNDIKEDQANTRYFFCFILKGLRSVLQSRKQMLDETIKQVQRNATQEKLWRAKLPSKVIEHIQNNKVRQFIQKHIQSFFRKMSEEVNLVGCKFEDLEIVCEIYIVNPHFIQKQLNKTKTQFDNMFNSLGVETIKQKNISIQKLQQFDNNSLFVESDSGISMISFNDIHEKYSNLKETIEKQKKKLIIPFSSHLLGYLRMNLKDQRCSIKFSQDFKLKVSVFPWNLKDVESVINNLIKRGQQQSISTSFLVSKDVLAQLKSKDILETISNKTSARAIVKEINYTKWRLKYMNGNRMYIKEVDYPENSSMFKLIFNQQQFKKHSNSITTIKQGNFRIDNQNKTIFLKNLTNFYEVRKHIKQDIFISLSQSQEDILLDLISQYKTHQKLPHLIIYTKLKIDMIMERQSFKNSNAKQQIEYGWIENTKQSPYNIGTQKIILNKEKSGQRVFCLNEDEMQIKQNLFSISKHTNRLKYLRNGKQFYLINDKGNQRYSVILNGNIHHICQNSYKLIQNTIADEVDLRVALYQIDLDVMKQTNLFTDYQRPIYKNIKKIENKVEYIVDNYKHSDIQIVFVVHKDSESPLSVIKKLMKNEIQYLMEEQLKFQFNTTVMPFSELIDLCQEKFVGISEILEKQNIVSVLLKSHDIRTIKQIVHDYKIRESQQKISNYTIQKIQYPSHWVEQKQQIEKIEVDRYSKQFAEVQNKFLNVAPIKKLYRIQNQFLWKKYSQEKKDLENIVQEPIKQMYLFHGTRAYNPENIYLDKEQSFNINFSSDHNFFGRGIYFAKDAHYSNDYAHVIRNCKQMLYCKVMVGNSQKMVYAGQRFDFRDTNLRDAKKKIKYESITSHYGKTDVYIVYKSRRAYPQYLIEY